MNENEVTKYSSEEIDAVAKRSANLYIKRGLWWLGHAFVLGLVGIFMPLILYAAFPCFIFGLHLLLKGIFQR